MKNKKILAVAIVCVLAVSIPITIKAYNPLFFVNRGWSRDVAGFKNTVLIDSQTGVNYIVISDGKSIAITPRYRADGTILEGVE